MRIVFFRLLLGGAISIHLSDSGAGVGGVWLGYRLVVLFQCSYPTVLALTYAYSLLGPLLVPSTHA